MSSYCLNNPVNMSDPTGDWPEGLEETVKIVSATVAIGTVLSGINGGVANSKKGNNYINEYLGGTAGGLIQGLSLKIL